MPGEGGQPTSVESIAQLLGNKQHSDVLLKLTNATNATPAGDDQVGESGGCEVVTTITTIPAHSLILRLRSEYFRTLFDFDTAVFTQHNSNSDHLTGLENGLKSPGVIEVAIVDNDGEGSA